MTNEQKEIIMQAGQMLYEGLKPAVDLINKIYEKIKEIFIRVYKWISSILNIKITTYSRKKKGNRYVINKIKSVSIYKYLMKIRK